MPGSGPGGRGPSGGRRAGPAPAGHDADPPVAQRPVEPKKQPLAVLFKRGGIATAVLIGR